MTDAGMPANLGAAPAESSACCSALTASAIIDAVENGSVDVAVVRGPMAGYLAARKAFPFTVEPLQSRQDDAELPMAFDISMGVRRGDYALLQRLNDSLERNHAAILAARRRGAACLSQETQKRISGQDSPVHRSFPVPPNIGPPTFV